MRGARRQASIAILDCFATLEMTTRGRNEELERPQGDRRPRGYAGASPAGPVADLAASRRPRRRRDRRDRHPDADRRRCREGGPGGHPVLRHRRRDLRLRVARLCRSGDDDPRVGQRLYLFLYRVRRADRLDGRRCADPRIYAGRQRRRGRLVGLCRRIPEFHRAGLAAGPGPRARTWRDHQRAGDLHHRRRRRHADRRNAGKRDTQRHPGGDEAAGAGAVHRRRAAGVRRVAFRAFHALRFRRKTGHVRQPRSA